MVEVTPEERRAAFDFVNERLDSWEFIEPERAVMHMTKLLCEYAGAAVEAQKEKDAEVDPLSVECLTCGVPAEEFCWSGGTPMKVIDCCHNRWRAAIRAGDSGEKERGPDERG